MFSSVNVIKLKKSLTSCTTASRSKGSIRCPRQTNKNARLHIYMVWCQIIKKQQPNPNLNFDVRDSVVLETSMSL